MQHLFFEIFILFTLLVMLLLSISVALSNKWYPAQLIYLNTIGRISGDRECRWLNLANAHLKSGKHIPVIFLSDYAYMKVYEEEKFQKFITDNPFYIMVFPDKELALFGNDKILVCSFYNLALTRLVKRAGYTEKDIEDIRDKGMRLEYDAK